MTADAFLAAVVTNGCDIRSVAHAGRQVTARQRSALVVRDPHCVKPGCAVSTGLEIDHVTPWASSRITTLDQLARLCRHHHRQKTYEGYRLSGPPGWWSWTRPAGDDPTGVAGDRDDAGPPGPEPGQPPSLFDP